MTELIFFGHGLPGLEDVDLPGKLIAVEGPDAVGRSTQVALLREWLEASGYPVSSSGLKRSDLAGAGIAEAKRGHTLGELTMALFYAADLADRLEREIIPALRAGFVVLTDRYVYSLIARWVVRGVDADWIRTALGFALVPDAVFYLRCPVETLLPRALRSGGFDYWESGMDFSSDSDYYRSYLAYQARMLEQFDSLAAEYGFRCIDATRPIEDVFTDLRAAVADVVAELKPEQRALPSVRQGHSPFC
jgi:dTMP kinase